jgi:hypothetical protein
MKKHMFSLFAFVFMFSATAMAQAGDGRDLPDRLTVRETCPASLASVKVDLKDTPGGIAVTFTAASSEVDELRRRVDLLARKHRAPAEESVDVERMPAGAMKYELVPDGARLVLTPMDPNRLAIFRSQVHMLVEKMREGSCEIMPDVR